MKKRSYKLAAVITLTVIAFGCRAADVPPPAIETREVKDDIGRIVKVPVKIERAISLAPSLTEMIFAAGAGDRLVGVTTYCNFPAEATLIEKVGDTQTPNFEKIIALKPQAIFVSTSSQLEAFTKTLDEQGIAVFAVHTSGLDDMLQDLRLLGELFETQAAADKAVGLMVTRMSHARLVAGHHDEGRVRPRVFVQISNEPLFTIGKESFLTDLVKLAGGESVTRDVATAYPKLSKEAAAAMNPDVIFLSDSDDNRAPSSVFKDSNAVKNGRVYRINADIISRPGPRLVDALEEIATRLEEKK